MLRGKNGEPIGFGGAVERRKDEKAARLAESPAGPEEGTDVRHMLHDLGGDHRIERLPFPREIFCGGGAIGDGKAEVLRMRLSDAGGLLDGSIPVTCPRAASKAPTKSLRRSRYR